MIGVLFTLAFLLASCATDDTISEPSPLIPAVQRQATYEVEKIKDVIYGYGYAHDVELDSTVETALMLDVYRPMGTTFTASILYVHAWREDLWAGQNLMKI